MINETLNEASQKMDKAVEVTREDFAAIRTGRRTLDVPEDHRRLLRHAHPAAQLASFTVPEARVVIVAPYDMGAMAAIEKAIRDSDLGVNPTNDGKTLRVGPSSPRSAARSTSRWPRGRPRTARSRSATSAAKQASKLEKDGEVGKDDVTGAEKRLDGLTKKHTDAIDELLGTRSPSCSRSERPGTFR